MELSNVLQTLVQHNVMKADFFDGVLSHVEFFPPKTPEDKYTKNAKEEMEKLAFYSSG
jgi:hypothetical protein